MLLARRMKNCIPAAGLDDTAKPHIKKKIPKYRLKKNSIPQLFNTVNPHAPPLEKTDK